MNKKKTGQATKALFSLSKSFGWNNVSVTYDGYTAFEKRFAGRAETGKDSKTDPLMGRIL